MLIEASAAVFLIWGFGTT